jgi:imidazolonepropionase-like amidohydrolase
LQTAISEPARFMGTESTSGAIAAGTVADLVLLGANPLEDIRNTRHITAVIANGRLSDRSALDRMLKEVESAAKKAPKN